MWWLVGCLPEVPISRWDPQHDFDGDGLSEQDGDCDDGDPQIATPAVRSWPDGDGDGLGARTGPSYGCVVPADRVDNASDCDDTDPAVGMGDPYWLDTDDDGSGAPGTETLSCEDMPDRVTNGDDCNDADAAHYPGAAEICGDGVDSDCSGKDLACALAGTREETDAAWAHVDADDVQGAVLTAFPPAALSGAPGAVFGIGSDWRVDCSGCAEEIGGEQAWLVGGAELVRAITFTTPGLHTRVAPAGDFDGDGTVDLLAASYCTPAELALDECPSLSDTVWRLAGPLTADRSIDGTTAALVGAAGDGLGASLVALGDLDGDGSDEVALGAPAADTLYVAYGTVGKVVDLRDAERFTGATSTLGWSAVALDVDGDALPDLFVGSLDPAEVWWLDGSAVAGPGAPWTDAATATWSAYRDPASEGRGVQLADAGDVDGDGLSDLIIGAADDNDIGSAWLLCGTPVESGDLDKLATGRIDGPRTFGGAVASAGDVDGDGSPELLVGAPASMDGDEDGAAYLLDGGCAGVYALSERTRATFLSTDPKDPGLGFAVLGPGDVDGDGWNDVVIGAETPPKPDDEGASAWLFLGP